MQDPVAERPRADQSGEGGRRGEGEKKTLLGKYELGRLLGCGASAKVYHARDLRSGRSVAVKCMARQRVLKAGLGQNVEREVAAMSRLRHPHVVRLHEVLATCTKIYFVMEFAKGGELFSRVARTGRLPDDLCRRYFRQLVSAVGYCHSRGVFHRDLKPENLLLDDSGDLKVSDFGLCAVSSPGSPTQVLHTLCGTPAYVAPEILAKKGYDGAKVDVWSCGVILFVLNAGYLPFNDPNLMAMYKKIYRGEFRCPRWTSPDLKRLLARLLDTNPDTRITVDGILHDPWFRRGIDGPSLAAVAEEDDKEEEDALRELNAFDIISFSSGFDLSGLIDPAPPRRVRLVTTEAAEGVLGRLEDLARGGEPEPPLVTRRVGSKGSRLAIEGRNGKLVAAAWVRRLNGQLCLVEAEKGPDAWPASEEFWETRLAPALKALALPPTAPPRRPERQLDGSASTPGNSGAAAHARKQEVT